MHQSLHKRGYLAFCELYGDVQGLLVLCNTLMLGQSYSGLAPKNDKNVVGVPEYMKFQMRGTALKSVGRTSCASFNSWLMSYITHQACITH